MKIKYELDLEEIINSMSDEEFNKLRGVVEHRVKEEVRGYYLNDEIIGPTREEVQDWADGKRHKAIESYHKRILASTDDEDSNYRIISSHDAAYILAYVWDKE